MESPGKAKMSRHRKKANRNVGKVGWCDGHTLKLTTGHFVFVRSCDGKHCDVNTFSSIVRRDGSINDDKVLKVENGDLYPVPRKDCTLKRFGGLDRRVIKGVPLTKIKHLGQHRLRKRHWHYIKRYVK